MPSISQSTQNVLVTEKFGVRVDRATATLPASTSTTIYTVTGGRVLLTRFIGSVTTIVQAQATTVKYTAHPATGTNVDLCTTVDLNAAEVGSKVVLPTSAGSAAILTANGAANLPSCDVVLEAGTTILWTTVATSTGAMSHSLWYMPIDPGAYVTAN